ncbi:TonB-dependent receptor domain-containing protein [Caulobacter vibrioides]|uniref:TonB-dependent receptor n=2 Tax=Caulobacter vibrioides TaxID=155892 RepID=Q9A3Q5_CAUVC|nr:TonB-dependent receptor [Caulobacter vibrioides]YP_002518622.1 TonB-dependent receptor [Caulobacter vibrioides NA1000]AAK25109.1 TonB-dependent receptor [Caulobacter vibrioides CB15]ACL96714.1 TonB-dependent receptor [Caulobacter vibrioides NA1000]ATC29974.1 TonB-dependent receptor [Caulobacter vibrioides]QXZ51496.1 TonB-dependent receptor [Caulobacter vibrioides]
MKYLLATAAIAPLLMFSFANAEALSADAAAEAKPAAEKAVQSAGGKNHGEAVFSTGVAKGRDRLDSATSTSALRASEFETYGARSLGEVLRNIPGIRAEYAIGEGNANYSIRGLPLSGTGSKYVQLQEDGLPVLEFGDMYQLGTDMFMRSDLNLSQIETIRGGSASTFASNSPGGVINLISKTGDTEGGAVQGTYGLNYGEKRLDADYGGKISDTLRFHVGGFYRQGEGPRDVGYTAYKGGQIKANLTKTFSNGYVRVYGKYLNDRTPAYTFIPVRVTGTNADPTFTSPANFDIKTDSLLSPYVSNVIRLDQNNNLAQDDLRDGQHAVVKSVGLDAQFEVNGWTITEKFRFSDVGGGNLTIRPIAVAPAPLLAVGNGGVGATLSFATGPQAGQAITSPATLNGNGLLTTSLQLDTKIKSLNNVTNDIRASRVWDINGGSLTTTAGLYSASQDYATDLKFLTVLASVAGDGQSTLINTRTAAGVPFTQDGYSSYGLGNAFRRSYDMNYGVNAPYASVNYHIGKIAVGGSLRYDFGKVRGTLYGAELGGGRVGMASFDMNRDGVISTAETKVSVLPLGQPGHVDYDYNYLSYSTGVNYRVAEQLAVFARYSRGGRASADKILFTPAVNYNTGKLVDDESAYDTVKQAELGLKYRISGVTFNVTGFSAKTGERNTQIVSGADGSAQVLNIVRGYEAKGVELEAAVRRGPFSVTAGATYTDAKITSDAQRPVLVGNKPRHQADFIYSVTPQVELKNATVGFNVIGTTSSYAQDTNQLKLPGYKLVNAFVQVRPMENVQLMLNVNNVFNQLALSDSEQAAIPATGVVLGRTYLGRTASATLRYSF